MRNKFGQFVKGNVPWTKGIGHTEETKLKISQNNYWNGKTGKLHPQWRGDKVGYSGIHAWVYKHLGKAKKCENPNCIYPRVGSKGRFLKKTKRYEWANKDHKYRRNLKDWISLCVSCHKLYDNGKLKL